MNLLERVCVAVNVTPSVIMNMDQFLHCAKVVKRLEVFPSYGNLQNISIRLFDFTEVDALTTFLESNGEEICIAKYFLRRKGIKLCAVPPAIKNLEIKSCYRSFTLRVNDFMQKAGMSVLEKPLKIPARFHKNLH
uniref:FBD domain-containing protein n=1 Tax=Panagrolaimus davidi TaxID=227884 RepID=A0A914PGK1_9BILA